MADRWLRHLRFELDSLHPPFDLWERAGDLQTREMPLDAPRRTQRLAAGVVALLIVGGVAFGAWALLAERAPITGFSQEPADVVELACEDGETLLRTPLVARQPDGLHFLLENPDGAEGLFVRDASNPFSSWARGALGEREMARFVLPVPAGDVQVLCLHPPMNTLTVPEEEFSPMTVVEKRTSDVEDATLTETRTYGSDLLERGWQAVQVEADQRLAEWAAVVRAVEMSADELARAMDAITSAIGSREDLHGLELRELMARRDLLCHRLPVDHGYRGGEYCD